VTDEPILDDYSSLEDAAKGILANAPADVEIKGGQIATILHGCTVASTLAIFAGLIAASLDQMKNDHERTSFMLLLNYMAGTVVRHEIEKRGRH
jgi:exosortase/archaeosortase